MTQEEFAETIFRMHEILHEIDLNDTTIGQCGQCRGLDEPTHFDLCPACYKALEERLLLIEDTPLDLEFRTLLEAVQDAIEEDAKLISVLISFRQGSRAVH